MNARPSNHRSLRRQRGTTLRRQRGTTLIEAMTALAVLAIGLTGFTTAMLASATQDRRNESRAAAQAMANELAAEISTWDFDDGRLAVVNSYTDEAFSAPVVDTFTVTQGKSSMDVSVSSPVATAVTETLNPAPDHSDVLGTGAMSRSGNDINLTNKGVVYGFKRYWNVNLDPDNEYLKVIAVHVTYNLSSTRRAVATAFTTVVNREQVKSNAFN